MSIEFDATLLAIIYGSIATAFVSFLSLSGACILPLVKGESRIRWMQFFIAMAVSTLTSDAFLHLIPEILHLHSHESHSHHEEEEHHHHEREKRHAEKESAWNTITEERSNLLWMSLVLLAVYCVYFFEFVVFYRQRHTHNPEQIAHCPAHDEQKIQVREPDTSSGSEENGGSEKTEVEVETSCCGLTGRAFIILAGDGVHNLVDGIAIGSSFMASTQLGIVTSIAVIAHELPHELGDLAVLLDSGISMTRALLLNLLSALTAFIGLFLAFAFGRNETTERILLALTAGTFLYVAWADMLHHLKHDSPPNDHWLLIIIIQLAGFLTGFGVIFTIGWFEHDLFN